MAKEVAVGPLEHLLDELERFAIVVAACERPDLSASNRDADSALHRLRSWARSDQHGHEELPPHLVACIRLDYEVIATGQNHWCKL